MELQTAYSSLPTFLQNLAVSLKGWQLQRRRYNEKFERRFDATAGREELTTGELQEYREKRLTKFLRAAAGSPFWKQRFETVGLRIDDLREPIEAVRRLPVLRKQEVKNRLEDLQNPIVEETITSHTSGTTGSGLVFPKTKKAEREQLAVWWRYRHWHGITRGTWCGYFGGRQVVPITQTAPPYWRLNYPGKQLFLSGYHLNADTAAAYVGILRQREVPWIHGYPSMIALLAGYMIDQQIDPVPSLKIITTGAENLLPRQRNLINEAFGVPVRQHYGLAEGVANISECEYGNLHVDEDFALVEFVPLEHDPDRYKIVGTNWNNPAFPLIRYDTGDIATLPPSEATCNCGRVGRLVESIDGRDEDYVVFRNGIHLGRLDHIFKDLIHIREAQIYQPDVSQVILRVVKGKGYDNADEEKRLLKEARKRLGESIHIDIEYRDEIPKTDNGKLRFVVSEV